MKWSKQKVFCNACGKELHIELNGVIGRNWRVCSLQCNREMEWRSALSLLNKEYEPDPRNPRDD